MKIRFSAFAIVALATSAFVPVVNASNPTASQITSDMECTSALKNTLEARNNYSFIGEKSTKTFEQLIERATQLCTEKNYSDAAQLLNEARGMVAGE